MPLGRPKKIVEPNHDFNSIVFTVFASALQISLDTLDKNKWPSGVYQHLIAIERLYREATDDGKTITVGELAEQFLSDIMTDITRRCDKIRSEREERKIAQERKAYMKREYGETTPLGYSFDGRWVLRDYDGNYIEHGKYRNDLIEKYRGQYDITVQGE